MIAKVFKHFSYENFNKLTIVIVQQNPIVCVVLFQVMVNLAKVSIKKMTGRQYTSSFLMVQ